MLLIALAVLGAVLLALGLARVIAQRAYDAATDSAAAAAAEFRPDVLVGSGAGGLVTESARAHACYLVTILWVYYRYSSFKVLVIPILAVPVSGR